MTVEVSLRLTPMQAEMCLDAPTEGMTGRLLCELPVVVPLINRHPLSYLRTGAIGSANFAVAWALLGVEKF